MADTDGGLYGYVSLLLGAVVAVVVARISRTRDDEPDLSTVEGLARELVRVRQRLADIEAAQQHAGNRLAAHGRYITVLQDALRGAGLPVPDPAAADAQLITG
ncbi:hypothetical protein RVR_10562 [Actinacidiphila reveromycinica]|uniref:Uncharacterized protein n=1 Tax=Actinacidiphila reveromycinica TaxID=659352 RepID=A0A7U3UXK9_9ACTN|nr:hypothetical protein [Streptomyces sp. SN-593]BBB00563.1 hypothetical protein RVR_7691 [Streptomyces sp. SN-593]BBB00616.1 hypothetical protein RVR_10562 [Streptomyces sp. SN-593]